MAPSEQTPSMDKATFLATLRRERAAWEALLATVETTDAAWMTQPGANSEWSFKDIIAHVTWYEREMVGVLHTHVLAGSPLWELPHDQRNTALFEQLRDQPLTEVLADTHQTFTDLVALVEGLAEEDCTTPRATAICHPTGYPGNCWPATPTCTICSTRQRSAPGWNSTGLRSRAYFAHIRYSVVRR